MFNSSWVLLDPINPLGKVYVPTKEDKMQIYQVGSDVPELYDYELVDDDYEWLVHSYSNGYYDGYGQAVALHKNGTVYVKSLDHCSCYGPFDSWETSSLKITVEELLREKDSVHDIHISEDIMTKVRELLG